MENKNHDLVELQKKIDEAYSTSHLTLPNIPKNQDPVRDAESDAERELILNPDHPTNVEIRKRLVDGSMAKGAPAEALASVGKHVVTVDEDGTVAIEKPEIKKVKEEKPLVVESPIVAPKEGETNFTDNKPTDFTAFTDKKK